MSIELTRAPRMRPIEAVPVDLDDGPAIVLRDPTRVSPAPMAVSEPVVFIVAQLDGQTTLATVRERFRQRYGQALDADTLVELIERLEVAHFLEGDRFEQHYASLADAYRQAGLRQIRVAQDHDKSAEDIRVYFDQILSEAAPTDDGDGLIGLIAPHLDYPRGRPCYASAYAALGRHAAPKRVVILGTNHFGRSHAAVATVAAFDSPLGRTDADVAFIERLERACGPLRRFEFDHANEHSVELQVLWLQHLFGAGSFTIVPVLCPDPCGPTGTAPREGTGVDLAHFARVLGELIAEDPDDTLVVAGADLSHVGGAFGDAWLLDDDFLGHVRRLDAVLLEHMGAVRPELLRERVAGRANCTRVCSVGCVYALMAALPSARARVLGYHQAVDEPSQTCVTCAAVSFHVA